MHVTKRSLSIGYTSLLGGGFLELKVLRMWSSKKGCPDTWPVVGMDNDYAIGNVFPNQLVEGGLEAFTEFSIVLK